MQILNQALLLQFVAITGFEKYLLGSFRQVRVNQYLTHIQMPFKHKLIKDFQKYYRSNLVEVEPDKSLPIIKKEALLQTQKSKHKKKITYKSFSFFQLLLTRELKETPHVFNFFNMLGINEQAIRDPEFDESVFTTLYYVKNVKKVEIKPNVVILHLGNLPRESPPIQYIIERFKSFGDARFYNLAVLIEQVVFRLQLINQIEVVQNVDDNGQSLQKFIESMANKPFYCRPSLTKIVFSKSFLDILEYSPEDFALDCVKYKACINQFVSAQPYFNIACKIMQNLRNLIDLIGDNISLQSFLDSSLFRFKGFMYTKNKKRLFCKLKAGMPNPIIHLFQIQEVVSRSEHSYEQGNDYMRQKKQKIQKCKQQRKQIQINKIRNVISLPKNFLPENQHMVTGCSYQKAQIQKVSIEAANQ